MSPSTLKIILNLRRINASELSRLAKITRQAISKWFSHAPPQRLINVEFDSITKVAEALRVSPHILIQDPFAGIDSTTLKQWQTTLLWDHLYDSLESFIAALCREELPAMGRYVQTFGILNAEKIFGKSIFIKFEKFSKFIHPAKRKELEVLCHELQKLNLL